MISTCKYALYKLVNYYYYYYYYYYTTWPPVYFASIEYWEIPNNA